MKFNCIALVCALLLASSSMFAAEHVRGQLKAGAAKVDVTPSPDQLRPNSYGILDHTHVRAIVFTNGTTIAGLASQRLAMRTSEASLAGSSAMSAPCRQASASDSALITNASLPVLRIT